MILDKSHRYININKRINDIYEYLRKNIENSEIKLQEMEQIIYEKR